MPRPLPDIRKDIDVLDQQIVTSLFEEDIDEKNPESADITAEEIAQIRALQLRFSTKTWRLINQRMVISKEVAESKKWTGKVVIDETRKKEVIEQAVLYAPEKSREAIRELYELIHTISVRIQNEIITQS